MTEENTNGDELRNAVAQTNEAVNRLADVVARALRMKAGVWIATRQEFADAVHISTTTLARLVKSGRIPHLRVGSRVCFEMPKHLIEYPQRFGRRPEAKRVKIVR